MSTKTYQTRSGLSGAYAFWSRFISIL